MQCLNLKVDRDAESKVNKSHSQGEQEHKKLHIGVFVNTDRQPTPPTADKGVALHAVQTQGPGRGKSRVTIVAGSNNIKTLTCTFVDKRTLVCPDYSFTDAGLVMPETGCKTSKTGKKENCIFGLHTLLRQFAPRGGYQDWLSREGSPAEKKEKKNCKNNMRHLVGTVPHPGISD